MKTATKLSFCFRPPPTIEIDDGVDCSADRMLSLIAAARNSNRLNKPKKNQEKTKKRKIKSPKVLESSIPDDHHHHPRPNSLRRSFSSVVKAVVFETSLSRRVREPKLWRNRSDPSIGVPPTDQKPLATAEKTTSEEISKSNSKSEPTVAEDMKSESTGTENSRSALRMNPVVCLILVSLWVTVFWGRACAVMTTTVGIYAWQSGAVVVGLGLGGMLRLRPWNKLVKLKRGPTISVPKQTNSLSVGR